MTSIYHDEFKMSTINCIFFETIIKLSTTGNIFCFIEMPPPAGPARETTAIFPMKLAPDIILSEPRSIVTTAKALLFMIIRFISFNSFIQTSPFFGFFC